MTSTLAYLDESTASGWERTLYGFLAEKERRSGSLRTVQAYSRMLRDFFGRAAKTPDQVSSQDVFAWAYGVGFSGRQPGSITIGARLACLSSFYRFLIRMKVVASNPCDAIERPRVVASTPRGLNGEQIRRLLNAIPSTPVGLRDRAIILTLTFTGRRRAEVLGMTAGSLSVEGGSVFYSYRGKGGKTGKRELPRPAYEALREWLATTGKDLTTMRSDESLWPDTRTGRGNRERDVLHQPPALPAEGRPACRRRASLPAFGSQAEAGRRRDRRGGVAVPGPQLASRVDDILKAAGGAGGSQLGEGSRGDRSVESRFWQQF
jgi:site-specific recombinase XerC